MASSTKIRKLNFQNDWIDKFFFIEVEDGAFCLLCPRSQKLFQSYKKSDFERHFRNLHSDICNLPDDSRSVLLAEKLQQLDSVKNNEMNSVINQKNDEKSTEKNVQIASYRLAYEIAKKSRPFNEGEFLHTCFNAIIPLLCPEMKSKFEKIALSRRSISRRIGKIHNYLNSKKKLCLFIRGINKNFEIFEELLAI